jgi:nitrogen fixation/metabolism regulation signal transduction histidine kinase
MAFESRRTRLALSRSKRRLSFERRIRVWLYFLGAPALLLCWLLLRQAKTEISIQCLVLLIAAMCWMFTATLLKEQIVRPLQTLSNVVAALREDDYSFRARGGRRNDALGDLALEINALAGMLQGQRAGALEAMALVERVMGSMQSPVLAFDPERRLKLLNAAGERAFGLQMQQALNCSATKLKLDHLLKAEDDEVLLLGTAQQATRWFVKRTGFRLRGVPHTLFVLSDVSAALREEERAAWERLIRVLGHEINNSLTPIKSIAESLRGRLATLPAPAIEHDDFESGLDVIQNRAESLNRFLQAYRLLMGLPTPTLAEFALAPLVARVASLETRVSPTLLGGPDVMITADADQLQQALINLVKNAAEAALNPAAENHGVPQVEMGWTCKGPDVILTIRDNGPGLINESNLFVPFYTTKSGGTGIGLVLAQQIAEGHRGTVRLRNRIDAVGCEVEFQFPATDTIAGVLSRNPFLKP